MMLLLLLVYRRQATIRIAGKGKKKKKLLGQDEPSSRSVSNAKKGGVTTSYRKVDTNTYSREAPLSCLFSSDPSRE